MTKIDITPKYSEVKPEGYYVYLHRRATDGSVFYVGKGKGRRGFAVNPRSKWWKHCADKNGVLVEVCQDGMNEYDSFTLELWLIAKFRRAEASLVNISSGGEGASGHKSNKRKTVYCSNGIVFYKTQDAANWLVSEGHEKATAKNISSAARGEKMSAYGFAFSYDDIPDQPKFTGSEARFEGCRKSSSKRVYGSNGKSYSSGREAGLDVSGSVRMGSKILECCNGKRKTAAGLTWSYMQDRIPKYEDPMDRSNRAKWKRVSCSNGMEFDSIKMALEWLSCEDNHSYSASAITQSISRGGKCGGYTWNLVDT